LGILSRIFGGKIKAAEGEYRPGPYLMDGGWLSASAGRALNWWQMGNSLSPYGAQSAIVEACISAYAQTAAMCPGDHWRKQADGGRVRVSNSALSRIMRKPNDYQTISDFMMNAVRSLYSSGETFALALRNDRFEIDELHLMNSRNCSYMLGADGSVFYSLSGNEIVERRFGASLIVPARDVLHIRLHTPRHPLKGESPILAAALEVAAGNVLLQRQLDFFGNQAKPSIMLSTDQVLTLDQVKALRSSWDAQTRGENSGGTPILTAGLKPLTVSTSAQDSQLAETMKMSEQNIALAFRVPLQILGLGGTTFANTELLMQSWIASGLGFCLNHVEEAFGQLFGLRGMPDEYLELDTKALLRSAFKDRIEGMARAVQGGIYSPDEARGEFDLPEVPGGHGAEPRLQQQVMPLSWHTQPATPPDVPPPAPEPSPPEPAQETDDDEQRDPGEIFDRIHEHARIH
jgi:HK97 family phage portal protein